jgi:hypothetical protein
VSVKLKAYDLQVGDVVSFEDAAYAYHGTIKDISPYTEVFFDGKKCKVDGLQVTMTNGNSYYFLRDSDMNMYRLKIQRNTEK